MHAEPRRYNVVGVGVFPPKLAFVSRPFLWPIHPMSQEDVGSVSKVGSGRPVPQPVCSKEVVA
jgi:hypothetical protein